MKESNVRVTKLELEFFLISFYFSFIFFYFYLLNLGLGFSVISLTYCHMIHDMVTSHVVTMEGYRRFRKNDII